MRYTITTPAAGFSGDIAGVMFSDGSAVADDTRHKAALAYFRRRGYTVEPESGPEPEQDDDKPRKSASKAAWAAYAVAHGMDEAEAEALTRDQLVERFSDEGEDQ